MKRISLISFTISIISFIAPCFAQNQASYESKLEDLYKNYAKEGSFILKGNVKNLKNRFVEFGLGSFINQSSFSISINSNGDFEQTFPISGSQKLFMDIPDNGVSFHVMAKDTIQINWDQANVRATFALASSNKTRNAILQTEILLNKHLKDDYINLVNKELTSKSKLTKEEKYVKINDIYNKAIALILKDDEKNAKLFKTRSLLYNNLIAQQYFDYTSLLLSEKILDKMPLKIKSKELLSTITDSTNYQGKTIKYLKYSLLDTNGLGYKVENENLLLGVPSYRDFLYDYLRSRDSDIFSYTSFVVPKPGSTNRTNISLKYYHKAKNSFSSTLLRDWFMAKVLDAGFRYYPFEEVKEVYDLFIGECKTDYFREQIASNFNAVKSLKPGLEAPNFTLKDEKGKDISLSDFKGKVIYIDFWGVNCAPCIDDIENYKEKLQSSYENKDVVFLNICVDTETKSWINAVKKLKLTGVNLIAEGWTKNPVCKAYNVGGIPHYVIINKNGTIANNNAPRMRELVSKFGRNELDQALGKP